MSGQLNPDSLQIRSSEFFAAMDSANRKDLEQIGFRRQFYKDEMLFQIGSHSDDVFILLSGRVKIFELSKEGKEVILWFCFPGELFGLVEAMKREQREVNAQACTPVEVLAVRQSEFKQYLQKNPELALQVIDLLGARLRELGDVLLNVASDDVTSRVVKLISRLLVRYGRCNGTKIYLDISLTHQEMADMIGASRQTVTTVLSTLKKQGLLHTEQRTLYIDEPKWIESVRPGIIVDSGPQSVSV